MVQKGKIKFQLQTEYASMPRPRVTTTVFSQGQVLHKIEKTIDNAVDSIEQMHHVEDIIKSQHLEVSRVIREKGMPSIPDSTLEESQGRIRSERMRQLDEIERVYLVTRDGKISGDKETTTQFKKLFKHVLKELPEMLKVFEAFPGAADRREEGIYEVEPGRIILASAGVEFYLILVKPKTDYDEIAPKLRRILGG
jgi:hypothetical protein